MSRHKPYLPFSQREGLRPIPPQLALGEVSPELRRRIEYSLALEVDRGRRYAPNVGYVLDAEFSRVALDLHVLFLEQRVGTFASRKADQFKQELGAMVNKYGFDQLFDLIEFFLRHPLCSQDLRRDFAKSFIDARAAYRIVDGEYVVAVGTEEQGIAFERALADTAGMQATGGRKHLIEAGIALRNGDWAGSVRESIHAVESIAVRLAPQKSTLGDALKVLEQRGHLHGALKSAFERLYGYSSDEEGVRHALVFDDVANVDEADALFMLGACASFVSYMLARAP